MEEAGQCPPLRGRHSSWGEGAASHRPSEGEKGHSEVTELSVLPTANGKGSGAQGGAIPGGQDPELPPPPGRGPVTLPCAGHTRALSGHRLLRGPSSWYHTAEDVAWATGGPLSRQAGDTGGRAGAARGRPQWLPWPCASPQALWVQCGRLTRHPDGEPAQARELG